MRRRLYVILATLVAGIGVWQLAEGLYIPAKAVVAQVLLHDAWRRSLDGEAQAKPWPWADTWPVARLRVPEHDVDQIVLAGASGSAMAFGPAHVADTPAPGAPGNSVIGGHRDTSLKFLKDLEVGERLSIDTPDGERQFYRVTGSLIVDGSKPWMSPETDDKQLSLVTCYPFDAIVPGGPLRYIVKAAAE